jgi:hypothetical protein
MLSDAPQRGNQSQLEAPHAEKAGDARSRASRVGNRRAVSDGDGSYGLTVQLGEHDRPGRRESARQGGEPADGL